MSVELSGEELGACWVYLQANNEISYFNSGYCQNHYFSEIICSLFRPEARKNNQCI